MYALGGQAQDAHASPSSRRVHRPDVELRVIEQRQVHLPAHRGNVGLVEEELGGMSPAVALGIAERPWSIGDLLDALLALEPAAPTEIASDRRRRFTVIDGGRS